MLRELVLISIRTLRRSRRRAPRRGQLWALCRVSGWCRCSRSALETRWSPPIRCHGPDVVPTDQICTRCWCGFRIALERHPCASGYILSIISFDSDIRHRGSCVGYFCETVDFTAFRSCAGWLGVYAWSLRSCGAHVVCIIRPPIPSTHVERTAAARFLIDPRTSTISPANSFCFGERYPVRR